MSAEVASYLKLGDEFVRIETHVGDLPDENYIEGAICCTIQGRQILGYEHWDLIDQLWAYIVEGLVNLNRSESYESSFPDQPLELRLEPVSKYSVKVSIGNGSHTVDRGTFVYVMCDGAERFFLEMNRLLPTASATWDRYLAEIATLKA